MSVKNIAKQLMNTLAQAKSYITPADISIYYEFKPPPYGGGNQFLLALTNTYLAQGYRVEHRSISPTTKACLFNSHHFKPTVLSRIKSPRCKMVHRVDGPIDLIRQDGKELDRWIEQQNSLIADATIFQSNYSHQQHMEMGLKFKNPTVIMNAPDPSIFHPGGKKPFRPDKKLRIVSSSWSDNMRKGFRVYEWLDQNLDWSKFEYIFVGNSPIKFKNIKHLPPAPSKELAGILRQQDIYITASELDPCSNALIEALHCGLPAIFKKSGGHPEIVGSAGLGFDSAEEIPDLLTKISDQYRDFQANILVPTLGEVAQKYLAVMGVEPA